MVGRWPKFCSNSVPGDLVRRMIQGESAEVTFDLASLIRRRRMTRTFQGGPRLDDVVRLAETAVRAPSAGFSQGVHLLILDEEGRLDFWNRTGAGSWFEGRSPGVLGATHIVLVFGDSQAYGDRYGQEDKRDLGLADLTQWQMPYWLVDAGMVAQNMLLLVEEKRWGGLFFGVHGDQTAYFQDLGVPETARCIGAIALGFRSAEDAPSGSPTKRRRRPSEELVHIGTWVSLG